MMETKIMRITPDKALDLLKHNLNRQRPMDKRLVEQIKRDIINGDFVTTHQGIALDDDGNLIDGQHRLQAIADSGRTVTMLVTTGMTRNAFSVVDTGKARTYRDYAITSGIGKEDPLYASTPVASIVRGLYRFEISRNVRLSNAEVKRLITGLLPWLRDLYGICLTRKKNPTSPVNAAVLAALINGEPANALSAFVQVFLYSDVRGAEDYNYNAALLWSKRVLTAKAGKSPLDRMALYYGTQNAIWHFINGVSSRSARIPDASRYPTKTKLAAILEGRL